MVSDPDRNLTLTYNVAYLQGLLGTREIFCLSFRVLCTIWLTQMPLSNSHINHLTKSPANIWCLSVTPPLQKWSKLQYLLLQPFWRIWQYLGIMRQLGKHSSFPETPWCKVNCRYFMGDRPREKKAEINSLRIWSSTCGSYT